MERGDRIPLCCHPSYCRHVTVARFHQQSVSLNLSVVAVLLNKEE